MDDNNLNQDENQPGATAGQGADIPQDQPVETPGKPESINQSGPIYEANPTDNVQPEEVAPDVAEPVGGDVSTFAPGGEIPGDVPPPVFEQNKSRYFIIAGGAIFFLLILIFLLRLIFGAKGPTKQITLTYWGLWEDKEVFAPIITDYQRKNPGIKIDYQKMIPQDYRDKLLARSKNGQGPDIFRFHNTWLPEITDVAVPLPENIMSSADFEKTFYKIHQTDLKIDNKYYGLPLYIDGLVLVYNNSLFKQAGIATAPTTWEDITDAVAKLTVKDASGQLVTAGIALGLTSNVDYFSDILGLMILQNGATLKTLDQPEASGALESFRKFAEPPNNFWDESMPNSVSAFAQEKVAMIFVPSWEVLTIKSVNPDLELKVVPVPSVPGGKPVTIASYWVEGVSKYSKNQLEAWKFLRYLVEKDTLTKLYDIESKFRRFGEPYSRVDLGSLLAQNEYVGAVIKQADNYVSLPLVSRTYDNGLNNEVIQYLENAVNATTQGVAYADALKTAKEGIDQVFAKYKIN